MESTIKWQTGEPKEVGRYLLTLNDGSVVADFWLRFSRGLDWRYFHGSVIAWCKLSDIEPYKKE